MTQTVVQDVMWLDDAAIAIRNTRFPAYFVSMDSTHPRDPARFYVVLPVTAEFRTEHESAWRRLTKAESFRVDLFDSIDDEEATGDWSV
jgi:hypothetical protein